MWSVSCESAPRGNNYYFKKWIKKKVLRLNDIHCYSAVYFLLGPYRCDSDWILGQCQSKHECRIISDFISDMNAPIKSSTFRSNTCVLYEQLTGLRTLTQQVLHRTSHTEWTLSSINFTGALISDWYRCRLMFKAEISELKLSGRAYFLSGDIAQ